MSIGVDTLLDTFPPTCWALAVAAARAITPLLLSPRHSRHGCQDCQGIIFGTTTTVNAKDPSPWTTTQVSGRPSGSSTWRKAFNPEYFVEHLTTKAQHFIKPRINRLKTTRRIFGLRHNQSTDSCIVSRAFGFHRVEES
jgi:hypothetical protein